MAGFGLAIIDFPANASAENLTPEHLNGLLFMSGPLYWIIVFTGMLFMGMYSLNEKRHKQIMADLAVRRSDAAAAAGR